MAQIKNKLSPSNLLPGLIDEEIERMVREAEENAEADRNNVKKK